MGTHTGVIVKISARGDYGFIEKTSVKKTNGQPDSRIGSKDLFFHKRENPGLGMRVIDPELLRKQIEFDLDFNAAKGHQQPLVYDALPPW